MTRIRHLKESAEKLEAATNEASYLDSRVERIRLTQLPRDQYEQAVKNLKHHQQRCKENQ